jgi:hypothetical protein
VFLPTTAHLARRVLERLGLLDAPFFGGTWCCSSTPTAAISTNGAMAKKKTASAHTSLSKRVGISRHPKAEPGAYKNYSMKAEPGVYKISISDMEGPVIYHGIKIDPIAGKRSALARAIRDDLRKQGRRR